MARKKPSPPNLMKKLKVWAKPLKAHPHRTAVIGLIVLGIITRFWAFGSPNQAVFDEVYFGKFVSNYFTHQYFFDIHPPLGKLIIAGFAWLFHFNPNQSFSSIGTVYTDTSYLYLRFLPVLAGSLLPVVFYGIARRLKFSIRTSVLIGLAICFDNAFVTQSRFILIDSFLFLFGFASLWAWLGWRNSKRWWWLVAAAVLAGMAVSVKWTGLTFIVLPMIVEIISMRTWQNMAKSLAAFVLIPLILYTTFFTIHLSLLSKTGDGDAFMSPGFQNTLSGSVYENDSTISAIDLPTKIIELNTEMYNASARLTATHPYGSRWWSWPMMLKPISYWVDGDHQIWLIGNPVVWWGSTIGLFAAAWMWYKNKLSASQKRVAIFLYAAYAFNYLPFSQITRVMFLYHYMIPLGFAVLISGLVLEHLNRKYLDWILTAILIFFIILSPYIYGLVPSILSTFVRGILPAI